MASTAQACVFLFVALCASQALAGPVYEVQQPISSKSNSFKVSYTPPAKNGPTVAVGGNGPFNLTAPETLVLTMPPCGVLAAHVHPRGTEYDYILSGKFEFGIVQEDGSFIVEQYNTGDGVVVPQGTVHYTRNTGCSQAQFFAFFDDPSPATIYINEALGQLPSYYLDTAFNISSGAEFNTTGQIFTLDNCGCTSS